MVPPHSTPIREAVRRDETYKENGYGTLGTRVSERRAGRALSWHNAAADLSAGEGRPARQRLRRPLDLRPISARRFQVPAKERGRPATEDVKPGDGLWRTARNQHHR